MDVSTAFKKPAYEIVPEVGMVSWTATEIKDGKLVESSVHLPDLGTVSEYTHFGGSDQLIQNAVSNYSLDKNIEHTRASADTQSSSSAS